MNPPRDGQTTLSFFEWCKQGKRRSDSSQFSFHCLPCDSQHRQRGGGRAASRASLTEPPQLRGSACKVSLSLSLSLWSRRRNSAPRRARDAASSARRLRAHVFARAHQRTQSQIQRDLRHPPLRKRWEGAEARRRLTPRATCTEICNLLVCGKSCIYNRFRLSRPRYTLTHFF